MQGYCSGIGQNQPLHQPPRLASSIKEVAEGDQTLLFHLAFLNERFG
jgi:hypothetical protein